MSSSPLEEEQNSFPASPIFVLLHQDVFIHNTLVAHRNREACNLRPSKETTMSAEELSLVVADASSIFRRVGDVVGKNVPGLGEVGTFDTDASPTESLQANVAKKTGEEVAKVVSEQHPEALAGEKRKSGILKCLSKRLSKTSFDDGSINTGASTPSSSGKSRKNLVKRVFSRLKKKNKVKTASDTTLQEHWRAGETGDASQVNKTDKPSDSEGPAKDTQTIETLNEKGEAATNADPLEPASAENAMAKEFSGSKLEGAKAQAKETVDGLVDRSLPASSSTGETGDASQVNKTDKPSDPEGPAKDTKTIETLKENGEAATAADPLEPASTENAMAKEFSGSKLEGAKAHHAKETVDDLVDRSLSTSSATPEDEMGAYKEIGGVVLLDMTFTRKPAPYDMPAAVERDLSSALRMFTLLLVLLGTVFSYAPPDFLPTSLTNFSAANSELPVANPRKKWIGIKRTRKKNQN
jgi:hypothetical protein